MYSVANPFDKVLSLLLYEVSADIDFGPKYCRSRINGLSALHAFFTLRQSMNFSLIYQSQAPSFR
jgi:hypothetical protein